MDRVKKYYRSQRRKRGARIAKFLRFLAFIIILAGVLLVIGSAGFCDCFGPLATVLKNTASGLVLLVDGGAVAGAAWIVDILTC